MKLQLRSPGETERPVGVLLMTFGTAPTLDDVPAYLASVRGGRPVQEELVVEFRRRFQRVGGSPLIGITHQQAQALELMLNTVGDGARYIVLAGFQHAQPRIEQALQQLAQAGARRIVGIVLSPQCSPTIMAGYLQAMEAARPTLPPDTRVQPVGSWHNEPELLGALAARVGRALEGLTAAKRQASHVLFTAHSLPQHVAEGEPAYIQALHDTARWVAQLAGLGPGEWSFAYQSAGHTREEWLKPDIVDVLPALRDAGCRFVLVAPVQFVADHLEVLYDIDVAAREQAEERGIALARTESLNTDPGFIRALAAVVRRELRR